MNTVELTNEIGRKRHICAASVPRDAFSRDRSDTPAGKTLSNGHVTGFGQKAFPATLIVSPD